MRLIAPLLGTAVLAMTVLAPPVSAAVVDSPHFDPETMMRVAELQRGMTGYGLTVFSGVEVTRFNIEVLGVISRFNLGEDLVLTSGPIIERQSGIIGGMSGSPIFVDGRLIGAIAYGWSFLREPIGGVTPIESMLDAWDGERQAALPGDHPLRGVRLDGRWIEQARVDARGPAFHDTRTINLRPVRTPVSVAGLGETAMAKLDELLEPHGLESMPGPGRLAETVPVDLQPGCAVGLTLMDGDFDLTAVGTLTWRDGNSILAFGHPMFQLGAIQMPMTSAWVHDFLPSLSRSNKISSPMDTVGAMTQDVAWSVGGRIGAEAPMAPGHFAVTDEDRGITREFAVRVAQQELLTPGLMMSALFGALEATYSPGSDGIGTLEFELRGDGGAVIRRRDVVWHRGMLGAVTSWVDEAMYYLTENRFEPQQVASLSASITLADNEKLASIERVYTDEHVARAGEQLTVHVVMRPEDGEKFERVVRFDLPEDLPKGSMRVGAASGAEEYGLRTFLRLLMPQVDSLEDLARVIETMKRSDQLYVAAAIPRVTVGMEGTELPRFPLNAVMALGADDASDLQTGYSELGETFDTDYYLFGWQIARLPTENRLGERGKVKKSDAEPDDYSTFRGAGELQHLWWATSALDAGARRLQDADLPRQELVPDEEPDLATDVEAEADEADADEEEEADEGDDGEHPEPDGEALARGLSSFSHTSAGDFEKGRAEGSMVRSDGVVLLAPRAEVIATADEPVIWSLAADGDAVWFGTGNPGRVYRRRPGGEAEAVCDTGSLLVLSLLPLGDGTALAGTGPDGRVLRIGADGAVEVAHDLPVSYVWALARQADGAIVAGTGPEGRIYRLGDQAELIATISQPHVLALAADGDRLYAAGGDMQATVFEIAAGGHVRAIFGTDDKSCTGLAVDGDGRLIVTTAMSGKTYVVEPDGHGREVYSSDEDVMHGAAVADGRAYAGTADDGNLVVIDDEDRTAVALQDRISEQIVRVAAGDGVIFAASAGPARVWRLDLRAVTEGTYRSPALDAERLSRWARMAWDATVPEGASILVDARSGNSEAPDGGSWSAWTGTMTGSGDAITAPAARYIQYRLRLAGSYADGPQVRRAELLYLPRNRRPELKVSDPEPGEAVRGDYEISWEADDDDDDTLVATIFMRAGSEEEWRAIETVEDDTSYDWDTAEVDDGRYALKIVVSDEPSNPAGAESDDVIVEDITVDNEYPTLVLLSTLRRDDDPREVFGLATDELTRITSIAWTFESDERWRAAPPADGLLDSTRELFTISLPEIPDDETGIQVRIRDAAGNVTVETLVLLDERPAGDEAPPPEVEGAQEQG